jgi:hypothetical protein
MIISKSLAETINFFVSFLVLYALSLTADMIFEGEFKTRHVITLVGSLIVTVSGKIVVTIISRREERKKRKTQ